MSELCCTRPAENTGRKNYARSRRMRIIPQLCWAISFATKACIDNRKILLNSNISSICPHNVVNFGPLIAEIDWRVWCTPANFNGFGVLASLLHRRRSTEVNQTLHTMFVAKLTLHPNLAFPSIGSVTARHSSSGRQRNFAAWYKEWNYGTFARRHFQQRAPLYSKGGYHVGHRPKF